MTYLPIITIIFILFVILFLMVKPLISNYDIPQKNFNFDEKVDLYFDKLIDYELKLKSEPNNEYLTASENLKAEIIAQLKLNIDYANSNTEEHEFIFLAKKKAYIARQINLLETSYYLNELDRNVYVEKIATLTSLMKKTEDELAPFIA